MPGISLVEFRALSIIEGFIVPLRVFVVKDDSIVGLFVSVAKTACPGLVLSSSVMVVGANVTITESPTGGSVFIGTTGTVGWGADTGGDAGVVVGGLLSDGLGQLHPHIPRICSVMPHISDGMIPSIPYIMICPQVASDIGEGDGRDMTASGLSSVQSGFPHK
jgi:hypothetical protein